MEIYRTIITIDKNIRTIISVAKPNILIASIMLYALQYIVAEINVVTVCPLSTALKSIIGALFSVEVQRPVFLIQREYPALRLRTLLYFQRNHDRSDMGYPFPQLTPELMVNRVE